MDDTGQFYNKENLFVRAQPIKGKVEFLTILVELSHIGLVDCDNMHQFYDKSTSLLDYVIETHDSELAFLLSQTLVYIQTNTKLNVNNDETCIKQLCELFLIQFDLYKEEIFLHALKMLNYVDQATNNNTFKNVLAKIEGNIYECFRFDLTVELLHSYLLWDSKGMRGLLIDMLTDWNMYESSYNEEVFEKLLWYGFSIGEEEYLAESIYEYDEFIKSNRWGIKFYLYLNKNLTKNSPFELKKINKAIAKFKKLDYYSKKEIDFITQTIRKRLNNHDDHCKLTACTRKKNDIEKEKVFTTINVQDKGLFTWPSTEISGTGFEVGTDSNAFNQKSALMNLGYRITGSTKHQRWRILERAVPALGLKKIAYIIAGNVKLRKGQKNGRIKFSYAISEWEYDLNKLKNKYYKKDFVWPST